METNKLNYYAVIPADVRYCKSLPMGAKLLYGEITALCNEKGYCWAKNCYFQQLYQVDKTTIIRWINLLITNNFIQKIKIDNSEYQRCLTIANNRGSKNATPSSKNAIDRVAKMQPSNNTSNITKDKSINRYKDKLINNNDITNYLIDIDFISIYELNLNEYNKLFEKYYKLIGTEELKKCISYIISKSKNVKINNKLKYIEKGIEDYLPRLATQLQYTLEE